MPRIGRLRVVNLGVAKIGSIEVILPDNLLKRMLNEAVYAYPHETIYLLSGYTMHVGGKAKLVVVGLVKPDHVDASRTSVRFVVDTWEMSRIIGVWHTHPLHQHVDKGLMPVVLASSAIPSPEDVKIVLRIPRMYRLLAITAIARRVENGSTTYYTLTTLYALTS